MIIVDLTVMNLSKQTLINNGLGCQKLTRETALKADTTKHTCLGYRTVNGDTIFPAQSHRLFQDDVFSRASSCHSMLAMLIGVTAYGNHINRRIL